MILRTEEHMIMKRLLSLILAAASVFTMSAAVLADAVPDEEKKIEKPTFAFDTDSSFSYIHKFGNASDTNLKIELADTGAIEGRALKLSEAFTSDVSNQYGGFYFQASDFDLQYFAGYTMTVNIKVTKAASKATPAIVVFGDGAQWVSTNIPTDKPDTWVKGSVSVPSNASDDKIGISIPITSAFTDDVMLIDNIVITDNYGKQIANVGDIDTSLAKKPNTLLSILSVVLFVVLFAGIIVAGVFIFLKVKRRYR